MKNTHIVSFLLLLGLIYYSINSLMPQKISSLKTPSTEFSTERALVPLKEISKTPHYVGSPENKTVREFLIKSLKDLGLSPEIQKGYVFDEKRKTLSQPINIIAKIKGYESQKALLIFSHYDSALTPSFGASDAGSGVVTILECVRAFIASGEKPKNDIIILFTDAEEIGLVGAKLFVRSHQWAKNIGLAINFEARGSGGPSSMIVETNQGNKNLIQNFIKSNPRFPVASSLLYSIYKMLPNDTDSTIFRKEGNIDGLFFAFIDDHFDYHTAGDNINRIDHNSLEHQGSYLVPIMNYFSMADLSKIKSEHDYVYTNFPVIKMIAYPFDWIMPSTSIAFLLFGGLIFFGFRKKKLNLLQIFKGFIPFILALLASFIVGFYGWQIIVKIYPHYNEILQGFTYNGHTYIAFFVSITVAITWYIYSKFQKDIKSVNFFIAPLFVWLVINIIIAFYLKGAAYFIFPFFFGLLSFWLMLKNENNNPLIHLLIAIPAVFIFCPLIQTFPIGLGLKMITVSTVLTVLVFGLMLSFFREFSKKIHLIAKGFFILSAFLFTQAHFTSDFNKDRKKPNSLVYFQDYDNKEAYWLTYDSILDSWTRNYIGSNPKKASSILASAPGSKYNSGYKYAAIAPLKLIPHYQNTVIMDTVIGNQRKVTFTMTPNKKANVLRLYVDKKTVFEKLSFNGLAVKENLSFSKSKNRLLTFYVSGLDSLKVSYTVSEDVIPEFTLLEYSFDLMNNPWIDIKKRSDKMMPKPFVFNDAIVVKQKINLSSVK